VPEAAIDENSDLRASEYEIGSPAAGNWSDIDAVPEPEPPHCPA
jgi:hypothetical protein